MQSSIELKDLMVYSDIYNLGLTDKDIAFLNGIDSTYAGHVDGTFYFKPTSKDYDIALEFSNSTYGTHIPRMSIVKREAAVKKLGYPAFSISNYAFFKFLPKVQEAKMMQLLVDAFHTEYDPNKKTEYIYKTMDEFKTSVFEKELALLRQHHEVDYPFLEACYWAADMSMPHDAPRELLKKDYESMPGYIQHITHVIQLKDDTRIAFFVRKREWNNGYSNRSTFDVSYNYYMTKPDDVEYNWTDPDKYFSHFDEDAGKPRVIYTDQGCTFPRDKDVIDNYRRGQPFLTVDNSTLSMLTARWMRRQQELANEAAAIKSLEGKLRSKIDDLEADKEFNYNDITFRKLGFEYENQVVSTTALSMKKVLNKFAGNYSEEHLNFDRVFDVWVGEVYNHAVHAGKAEGKIGDVIFTLEVLSKKAKNGVNIQTFRVNGCRINKDEVSEVLGRAICFPTTADFDQFCKSVSACSLRYHKVIASGIIINVMDEIFGEEMEFKISLERNKNKNYISFNKKEFKVGDTNKLLTLTNAKNMSRVIAVLLDDKAVGMQGADIKNMLETGKKTLIEQRTREKDLLESTMKMFGIEFTENFKATNGKILSGYVVRGKLRNYLVEKQKCMVYEYPTGRYICMVDKSGNNEHSNVARIVNRFFALSNDSKLAKEISTL